MTNPDGIRTVKRYTVIPFPEYRYIPFQPGLPHPRNDPRGHSYHHEEEYLPGFSAGEWPTCKPYLYGVDLFNQGYWWEAHEAWEQLWLASGRNSLTGLFIQGLIQVAAGQLKRCMDEKRGFELLTESGLDKIRTARGRFLGIDIDDFVRQGQATLEEDQAAFPVIILRFPEA